MATFLSMTWFQERLAKFLERRRVDDRATPSKDEIHSLLYLYWNHTTGDVEVYRKADRQMILSMSDDGDITPCHYGYWDSRYAVAISAVRTLLARIHAERTLQAPTPASDADRDGLSPAMSGLERSFALESFFDIVDTTASAIAVGMISPDLWPSSRERFDDCLLWAKQFASLHADTRWGNGSEESDYFDSIERFTVTQLTALSTAPLKG